MIIQAMKKVNLFLWITMFSVSMGLLECVVVIYLRELYYPEGFSFPLKNMDTQMLGIELLRETATLLMLLSVGMIAGRTGTEKFAWFIFAFAVWDIFYYVFLKLLTGWPESLMTWDILFLIPATWVGPVLAPLINSLTMIALARVLVMSGKPGRPVIIPLEWILLIAGSLIVIFAYTLDYMNFMNSRFSFSDFFNPSMKEKIIETACGFVPIRFPWVIFLSGVVLHLSAIFSIARRKFPV